EARWDHGQIADFVVMRSDRSPTYLLAVTYDDEAMGITHIIRGGDILASTPPQLMFARAPVSTLTPEYAHLPLTVGRDRAPLPTSSSNASARLWCARRCCTNRSPTRRSASFATWRHTFRPA